jgi:hypothetical protein
MASIHRRTVRWTTQGGHQADRSAAGKETLRSYATGGARIRSGGPRSFRIGRGVRYWHNEVTTWLQTQSDGPTAA